MADKKLSELTSATSVVPTDLFYVAQSGQAKKLAANVLFDNMSNVTLTNKVKISGSQTLTIASAITAATTLTKLSNSGTVGNLTLEAGTEGQIKVLVMTSQSGVGSFTLDTGLAGNASILFDKIGKSALLLYTSNLWHVIGGTASVTLP